MNLRCYSDGGGRNVPLGMIVPEMSPGRELASPTDWVGRLRVGVGMALFSGQAGDSDLHAHGAMQIALALNGELCLHDSCDNTVVAGGFVIPSWAPHRITADENTHVAFVFIEPDSQIGRHVMQRFACMPVNIQPLSAPAVSACMTAIDTALDQHDDIDCALQNALTSLQQRDVWNYGVDLRVARVMLNCRKGVDEEKTIEELAGSMAISSRYLRKLFERDVGMSVQRFRMWAKLRVAIQCIVQGENLTTAAHAARFSDLAHFSRTFRSMFGVSPSCMLRMYE